MICPSCSSENVTIEFVQTGGKAGHRGVGLGGHTNNAARGLMAISTLGMSNLVWRKSKGSTKQKFKNTRMCLCQGCGHSWGLR